MSARTEAVHRWARLEIGEGGDSDDEFLAEVSELWVVALRLGLRPEDDDANASVATWENLMAALKQARPDAVDFLEGFEEEDEVRCPFSRLGCVASIASRRCSHLTPTTSSHRCPSLLPAATTCTAAHPSGPRAHAVVRRVRYQREPGAHRADYVHV